MTRAPHQRRALKKSYGKMKRLAGAWNKNTNKKPHPTPHKTPHPPTMEEVMHRGRILNIQTR